MSKIFCYWHYSKFFLSMALILSHRKTIVMRAMMSIISMVMVTPTNAAVSIQTASAGTELVLITTSSSPFSFSWNWTSEGATTRMIRSVSISACSTSLLAVLVSEARVVSSIDSSSDAVSRRTI